MSMISASKMGWWYHVLLRWGGGLVKISSEGGMYLIYLYISSVPHFIQ